MGGSRSWTCSKRPRSWRPSSGSPLSQKTLAEAEELITKQGSFAEIETQAQAIAADVDRLDHAHQVARTVLESVTAARPKIDAGLEEVKKLGLPTAPYQEELGADHGRIDSGEHGAGRRSAGNQDGRSNSFGLGRTPSWAGSNASCRSLVTLKRSRRRSRRSGARWPGTGRKGLKLIEDGGNPDPLLSQASRSSGRGTDRARGRRSRRSPPRSWTGPGRAAAGGPGHDRQGPEGPGVLRARPAGPGTRNRTAAHGLASGRVVSRRPRARVCPIVVASGVAQPRPGPVAAGDLRPAGRAGRGGRDHDADRNTSGGPRSSKSWPGNSRSCSA